MITRTGNKGLPSNVIITRAAPIQAELQGLAEEVVAVEAEEDAKNLSGHCSGIIIAHSLPFTTNNEAFTPHIHRFDDIRPDFSSTP